MNDALVAALAFAYAYLGLVLFVLKQWTRKQGRLYHRALFTPWTWRMGHQAMDEDRRGQYDLFGDPSVLLLGIITYMALWPIVFLVMVSGWAACALFGRKE